MAKKVILKDQNEIEILPITRGELVLDSSGKKAFHSEEFLATSSQPGLMSKTDKTKVDNATTLGQAIPYIVGNASDSAGTWTGSYTGINEYTDGLTIIYVPKVAGASTTTLNINNLGAKTCYYTGTSKLTTHYAANTPILLTYQGGYWKRADYNVDTYTSAYSVTSGGTAGKTASCSGYQLKPNSYTHITFTNANTYQGALTLNINTRGAKPIWINRKASSSSNYELPAGTYLAHYDGSSYHIRTDGTLPGIIEDSYGAKYISQYVNTTSSATTSKNKYYKFATINLTDANWSECSINFLFAAIENTQPNGLLALSVRRGSSITALMGTLNWLSLDDEVYKDSVVLCNTNTEGVYDLYLQPKKDYCTVRITAITPQYTKLQMFRGGYFEEVTPRITSRLSGYVHHAEKITCTESTSNKDYPIISTYDSNSTGIYESLLYNPNITLNPSTGEIKATKFTGIFNGTSNQVANNLILKIKSGSTEGTSLYTYNGSSSKTLDIKQGDNITLTAAAGSLSIAASDTKVKQNYTEADAYYRVLLSATTTNSTETDTVKKSPHFYYNPSKTELNARYITTIGIRNANASDLEGLSKAGLHLSYLRCSKGSFANETGISVSGNANGVIWVGTHAPEGTNTSEIGYGHMLGFIGGNGSLHHKIVVNGDTTGSWRQIAYTHSDITGNAASADKLKTKRKLWGQDFDGTADVKGSLSDVVSIIAESGKALTLNSNHSIYLRYNGDDTKSVCLISDAFIPTTASSNILNLGSVSNKWKGVYAGTFYGNLSWNYITDKPTSFTPAAHTHNELTWTGDVRNVATQPSDYKKVFKFVGIKTPEAIGLTKEEIGNYATIIGWKGYMDNSGPHSWELASTNKERIYVRSGIGIFGDGSGNENWKAWHNIAYTTDNFPSNQITALTGYSKATSAADLATTDTLNVALGKLEYKAHYAYNWINTVTDTDQDEYINKWGEIVDFLDSVKEGTDILDEFVTRKTAQTITGLKTFQNKINIKTAESNKTPRLVFDEYYSSSSPSWVSEIVSDYYGTNICKTTDFTHGLYITLGRSGFDNLIILNSSKSPIARISKEKGHWFEGTLTVTGNTTSAKFITSGGTASQFVKGDGSLDSTSYATSASLNNYVTLNTEQSITAKKTFTKLVTFSATPGILITRDSGVPYIRFGKDANTIYGAMGASTNGDIQVYNDVSPNGWNTVLHSGNYSNYLPTYDGNRMTKDTKFYKRYITVNGTNYAFVSNTNSSTSATIYAHTSVDKDKLSYSTASGLSYTALKYLKFAPNDNGGYPLYLLIADLTNWVKGTQFSAYLIGTMYGQRAGNQARSVVHNICAHMTSYTGGSQWTLYTDIYNQRVLQPYVVIYNGTKYLALKKNGSQDIVYFVGLAAGLLDTYIHVPCPNDTDLPEGLTIECSPTTTSMYIATTKVWDGTNVRDIIHSGNYTTYSGYIGTTKVQATGAEQSLTGIKNITATGSAIIKGALTLGKADSSNLFFERTGPAYIWSDAAEGYLTFGVKDVGGTSNTNASLVVQATKVLPGMRNDAVELGSSSYRWKNVYSKQGNFLNQVLIGTETALDTGCILNIYGHTYQRGEFKITNDVHGVRLLGNGGFGYIQMGNISDITQPHYGKITGISARYLSSLDVDCLQTNLTGRLKVANVLSITTTSNAQFLLMGNQDGSGTDKPAIIRVANGIFQFGNGDSWTNVTGGTFTEHLKITSSQITSARKISAPQFIKSDSSNSYILLGGGGHKALSDFALKSELNDLALSNNVITFSKEITVGSDWVDTGIVFNSTNFPQGNGSYLVQLSYGSSSYIYTGVLSVINSQAVSKTRTEEILLHGGGFDSGSGHYYLRTYGDATDKVFKLQIARSTTSSTRTYTFKFIKLL